MREEKALKLLVGEGGGKDKGTQLQAEEEGEMQLQVEEGGSNIAAGGGRGATHVAGRGTGNAHAWRGRRGTTGGRGGMSGDRAYWLLFGEERRVEIPDLNDSPEEFLAPDP